MHKTAFVLVHCHRPQKRRQTEQTKDSKKKKMGDARELEVGEARLQGGERVFPRGELGARAGNEGVDLALARGVVARG